MSHLLLSSYSVLQARLKLLPRKTGELRVLGVVYNLGTKDEDNSTTEGIFALVARSSQLFLSCKLVPASLK